MDRKSVLMISPMTDDVTLEIDETTKIGESKLEVYLEMPRKMLKNGDQDYSTYAILLSNPEDIDLFEVDHLYKLNNKINNEHPLL